MIPGGDHSTRSIVHRRISSFASWSEAGTVGPRDEVEQDNASEDLSRPLLPDLEYESEEDDLLSLVSETMRKANWKLWLAFSLLLVSGVSNVVLAKLQSLPMYNYPTFLNFYGNAMYVTLSFCYILPVSYFGFFHNSIPRSHLQNMSKRPFMIMGLLDAVAGAMQVLSTIYLPGTLLVLLPHAAIPLSMLASRIVLREKFTQYQYLGALIVMAGIVVVLFPVLTQAKAPSFSCQAINEEDNCVICQSATSKEDCESHRKSEDPAFGSMLSSPEHDCFYCRWVSKEESLRHEDVLRFVWSLVMLVSCIPMVMSTVYKQVALQVQLDPILINGWVSLFQLVGGLFLVVPAGYASSPKVKPLDLPENWADAVSCLFAQNNSIENGCHPDECSRAALWVHLGLLSAAFYTVSMILVLKYGSASLLYLGLTLMVPIGHLAFSLHDSSDTQMADIAGLIVLVSGLVLFRFGHEEPEEVTTNEGRGTGYAPLSEGEAEDETNLSIAPEATVASHSIGGATEARNGENGFLEFLREPFMLVGDI